MPDSVRCGRIIYTNDLPLYAAFDAGAVEFPGTLYSAVPTRLNLEVIRGNLDMGPMSAAYYARHADELMLIDGPCVGARDYARSVVLVSPTAPHLLDGAEIAVTRESATARALLQILLERRYGVRAAFASTEDTMDAAQMQQPTLVIGDQAIDARERFDPEHCYDLSHLWHEWTEADMVFAVWVMRRDSYERQPKALDAAVAALAEAQVWGEDHLAEVVARAQQIKARPEGFYEEYYTDALNFHLDLSARVGLARFIAEMDAVGLLPGVLRSPEVVNVAS
ncbi:MAG: menaquinone biosynthetic enzyme MqnA/MqnD family protein [Vulcanimicrobiaceae bacterium]